ncbi:dual specificity protein kinase shkD [Bactrocera dorsalis]|uniref:Dual specificity protein kinase shkD n=1 Tax=Bactrocera dorsalis TaxID=27457 RepID=A0ABM3JMP8_BACDO|nr:dual specificity protein kinase shkD [Bactrocera dorsalis]
MEKGTILLLIGCVQILHCLILVNSENGIATSSEQNALTNNTAKNNAESLPQLLNTTGSNAKTRNVKPTGTENNTKSANVPIDRNNNKTEALGKNDVATINSENKEVNPQNSTTNLGVITVNATEILKDKLKTTILKPGVQNENNTQSSNKTTEIKYITKPTPTTASTKGKTVSSNSTATTTTKATTTTTTTTTPKPKKPSITFGLGDFPILPGESNVINAMVASSSKLPVANDPVVPPNVQPSQELNNGFNYYSSRDYIVPIMTVLFTIPLAIGVVITTYRRFRDCWSTRHYRRMDFLVDGMYND